MTIRIRPNRLGYVVTSVASLFIFTYLLSTQFTFFSADQMARLNILFSHDTPISFLYTRNQSVFTDPKASAILQQNIIRITLAQKYENARISLVTPQDEEGESSGEEESHEDYISRLSTFVLNYFKGSSAKEYLVGMLTNLNDHISPPLLKGPMRKGMIKIINEGRRSRKRSEEWEMNVFDKQGMDRGLWALSKGSENLEWMWRNLTVSEDRKILLKYLALLLRGGAYAEDNQIMKSINIGSTARKAFSALSPLISDIRTELQPLGPPPLPLPEFIPPSQDSKVVTQESDALKGISLVLYRRPGSTWVDRFPLSSETIMVKAFHPVFLDIAERISSQIEGLIAAREEGRPKQLDDISLFHDAIDRYLQVQYGTSLEDLIYRNEDLRIGDVLLLRSRP